MTDAHPIDAPDLTAWADLLDNMIAEHRNPSAKAPQPPRNPTPASAGAKHHGVEVTVPRYRWPTAHTELVNGRHPHTASVHRTEHAIVVQTTPKGAAAIRRHTQPERLTT